MPLFSVIVPTYNRPSLLAEALESVRAQSVEDFECIVVEDAPPSSSLELPADPRFRLIRHKSNQGAAAARNTGIRHASGEYVAFLDDDDIYTADRLELSLPHLVSGAVVICARGRLDGSRAHYRNLQGEVSGSILHGFTPHLGQTTIRRLDCPLLDERYTALEDVEWWIRVSRASSVTSTPRLGYLMRRHAEVRHGNGPAVRAECSRLLLHEYADYFQTHRRARAFRLERLARLEAGLGRGIEARNAAWKAFAAVPHPRTLALALSLS